MIEAEPSYFLPRPPPRGGPVTARHRKGPAPDADPSLPARQLHHDLGRSAEGVVKPSGPASPAHDSCATATP